MKIQSGLKSFAIAFCTFMLSCDHANPKTTTGADSLSQHAGTQRQLQQNKALVLKLYQALNDTNWTVAETLVDKDFQHHFVKDSGFGVTSWNGFKKGYSMSKKAFPDWKLTAIHVVAEGDYVAALVSGQGTHRGEFAGLPATNKKAGAPIMLLHQVKGGKIIADWEIMNTSSFLDQVKER